MPQLLHITSPDSRKDQSGVILQVGIDGYLNDVEKIANSILGGGQDEYYVLTPDKRHRAKVHARRRPDTGRLYLTTSPDGREPNNLDSIQECMYV